MKIIGNEPAYPLSVCCNEHGLWTSEDKKSEIGLTIRQQFAMSAKISFNEAWNTLSKVHPNADDITTNEIINTMAELKVMAADALIAELNRTEDDHV